MAKKAMNKGHKPPLWCALAVTTTTTMSTAPVVAMQLQGSRIFCRSEAMYGSAHGEWESRGLLAPADGE